MSDGQDTGFTIGCLTGDARTEPIPGTYAYHAPGLTTELPPDLHPDHRPGGGPFGFDEGLLTTSSTAPVGWRGTTVGEAGVDILVGLGGTYFVDHVVVRELSRPPAGSTPQAAGGHPDAGTIEAAGHPEPEGLAEVQILAAPRAGTAATPSR